MFAAAGRAHRLFRQFRVPARRNSEITGGIQLRFGESDPSSVTGSDQKRRSFTSFSKKPISFGHASCPIEIRTLSVPSIPKLLESGNDRILIFAFGVQEGGKQSQEKSVGARPTASTTESERDRVVGPSHLSVCINALSLSTTVPASAKATRSVTLCGVGPDPQCDSI